MSILCVRAPVNRFNRSRRFYLKSFLFWELIQLFRNSAKKQKCWVFYGCWLFVLKSDNTIDNKFAIGQVLSQFIFRKFEGLSYYQPRDYFQSWSIQNKPILGLWFSLWGFSTCVINETFIAVCLSNIDAARIHNNSFDVFILFCS